jgi:hypothetical protein
VGEGFVPDSQLLKRHSDQYPPRLEEVQPPGAMAVRVAPVPVPGLADGAIELLMGYAAQSLVFPAEVGPEGGCGGTPGDERIIEIEDNDFRLWHGSIMEGQERECQRRGHSFCKK